MDKKISVIIPAHNEEKYIAKTIGALNENKIPFELIVVCDSCLDNTYQVAKNYGQNVYNVDFKNVSKTRNYGVEKSSGNILVFVDADTIVSENYFEEILKTTENYDYGCAKWISESKTILGKYIALVTNNYNKKNIGGNFFVKKDLFQKVGGFNENMKMGEDTDLGDRLKKIKARYCFMKNCYIIPSERKYQENGYLFLIIKSIINGLLYKFFRNYYNIKIGK